MSKVQIKRGLQEAVNTLVLDEGELALAKDTGNLYVGTTAGVVHVNPKGGTAESAAHLSTAQTFSITGDGTANGISFNGTQPVALELVLKTIATLNAGTYSKLTVDTKGRVTKGEALTATDIPNLTKAKITDMPTKLSDFTNDSGYQTQAQVQALISALVDSSPETLDTLKELATALGNDPNFATTMTNSLATKEPLVKNATAKTTLVDADTIIITDSAASNATKKVSITNLKSTLKTYFDTLYGGDIDGGTF